MPYMYSGTILLIDLGEGKISKEPTTSYSGAFLGGRGINIKLLYDGVPPEIDPLDPASPLIFGAGPLCGTPVPASRTEITAKSPETGFLGMANFGGYFGPELKFAGYDHIVITGKADKPVYIWIENERVEIRDASEIWGKDTYETQAIIRSEVDPEAKVACIGPAGENLVRFASVQHGLGHGAARNGMGAVMGSKNLKAIVIRGTKGVALANPERYLSLAEELQQELRNSPASQERQQYGMTKDADLFRWSLWDPDWKPVSPYELFSKYKPRSTGCFGCPKQCMDLYPVGVKGGGTIHCCLYSLPMYVVRNGDPDLLLECSFSAQRYGVDIISCMKIIGWVMEIYEKGLITAKDTDGIPMEGGNRQAIMGTFKKIVYREGFGNVLADGMLPAAERIGRGSKEYAYQVKGLPHYAPYVPNTIIPKKGEALAIVVSSRGDTMRTLPTFDEGLAAKLATLDEKSAAKLVENLRQKLKERTGTEKAALPEEYEGKPELVIHTEDRIIIGDCLSACKQASGFGDPPFNVECWPEFFSIGTGVETSVDTLLEFAKRVRNLERTYNVREGMTRDTDSLPKGYMDHPVERGKFKGSVLESSKFEKMKSKYYALRGWDIATGIPTRETLEQTGLGDVAKDLEKRGKLPKTPLKEQSKTEER